MAYYGTRKEDVWEGMEAWLRNRHAPPQPPEPPAKLNQISPQQRGYRDGWRAPHDPRLAIANGPYAQGTWAWRQWFEAFLDARMDRAAGNTQ